MLTLYKNKHLLYLFFVFVVGLILRIYQLESIPVVLNRDEAALAYNAYLIKETGKDEWQVSWPLTLKSFGDYKLPGYPYLLAGLFTFLPLSDLVVRLPSALAGSLLILVSFYFAHKVVRMSKIASLFLALLVAINPIFFFYSRIAFEANVALLLLIIGLILFLEKKILLGLLVFTAAVLTYNTPLLLLPFIALALMAYLHSTTDKKWLQAGIGTFILFAVGVWGLLGLASQKSGITIFNDPTTWENYALYRQEWSGIWQTLLGNRYIYYLQLIWQNVIESFSFTFVVKQGGSHPWHALPGYGHLFYLSYFLALAMIIDGIGAIILGFFDPKARIRREQLLILYLLIVGLAPSVVTVDSPHATRSLLFFFMLLVLAALFFDRLYQVLKNHRYFLMVGVGVWLLIEGFGYYQTYFTRYSQDLKPPSLHSEYVESLIKDKSDNTKQPLAVVDEGGYQYIVTAWYLRVPATDFFATMKYQGADQINFHYGEQLLNYHFIKSVADKKPEEIIL